MVSLWRNASLKNSSAWQTKSSEPFVSGAEKTERLAMVLQGPFQPDLLQLLFLFPFFINVRSLLGSATHFWLARLAVQVLLEQRRGFGVVYMKGMDIVSGWCRRFIAERAPDTEQLEETGNPDDQVVAILLHFK